MNKLSLNIAWRYLFGKKSTNAINIITGLSILGITIGTAALILILSVFNGFEGLLSGMFNAFNPDLRLKPESGKMITVDSLLLKKINGIEGVLSVSKTLEEVAVFEYKDVQDIGYIKGVDQNYQKVTNMDSTLVHGKYKLYDHTQINKGIIGIGLRNKLSVNIEDKLNPITVYMFKNKSSFSAKEYRIKDIYPSGIFSVKSDNDQRYVLSSYEFAASLLAVSNDKVSFLEIKIDKSKEEDQIRNQLLELFNTPIIIENRAQQDASFLKIMNIEKWVSFLIVSLTLLLIAFNLVGALWMIILEKRKDIAILKSLGFSDYDIRSMFLGLGLFITILGIVFGFVIAILGFLLQKNFGIIGIPDGFLIDAYPIKLKLLDFIRVTATVLLIGFLASLLPASKASKFSTYLRTD